jgi:diacylglycerol kinase
MMCLKFIVILVVIWITGAIWFEVNTPIEVKDKIVNEFHEFFSGVKNVAAKNIIMAPGASTSTLEISTDL